jgi:hypothetical protein
MSLYVCKPHPSEQNWMSLVKTTPDWSKFLESTESVRKFHDYQLGFPTER